MGKKIEFKVGDLVVYVGESMGSRPFYSRGKIYKVVEILDDTYAARILLEKNDLGAINCPWYAEEFKKIPKTKTSRILYEK